MKQKSLIFLNEQYSNCNWLKFALIMGICLILSSRTIYAEDDITAENLEGYAPLFPFVITYADPGNVTSMGHLIQGPAGKDGFVKVVNGRFATDAGPIRFHATNLTGPANFPTHAEADKLAERLARFGFNCVRLHYFDSAYGTFKFDPEPGIIAPNEKTQKKLDPVQRDKQDYLIAALKKRGIYVDMNLHVARFWDERDGFTGNRPWADKGLDNFEPRMIELQKEYARELLTHVNPYTGLAYVNEPSIAMIEINNENSLTTLNRSGGLKTLPEPYQSELKRQWNVWLKKKYKTTDELRTAWHHKSEPLHDEQINDGSFSDPVKFGKEWIFSKGTSQATAEVKDGVLTLQITKPGEEFFPKFFRNIKVKANQIYTFSFRIRRTSGQGNATLGLAVADGGNNGWRSLGFHQTFDVTAKWKKHLYCFESSEDSAEAQIQITRFPVGTYEIDDLSFQCGTDETFAFNGSLEEGTVSPWQTMSKQSGIDFAQFLFDTEHYYWNGINNFLKDVLHARQIVSGTQLGYSPSSVQAQLDYVDHHAYWCHPSPVSKDWRIGNRAMVRTFSSLLGLMTPRVYGKPYTVSEYNHPFPNLYGTEGQPMLRAYGRFQGWDGVFEYTYNHSHDFEPTSNTYFFSIIARTDVLAHMPACAAIFLRGDVQEGKKTIVTHCNEAETAKMYASNGGNTPSIQTGGVDGRQALVHKVAVVLGEKSLGSSDIITDPNSLDKINARIVVSDTNELFWNREEEKSPYWMVNTVNTKLFTGFPANRKIDIGNVSLSIGKTRMNWATVSLVSRFAQGFGEQGKANILLTATGYCGNKDMKFDTKVAETSLKLSDWGTGPIMNEGIPAEILLPANPKKTLCYALDTDGQRKLEVPVQLIKKGDKEYTQIKIDPKYKTIWYEINIQE